MDADRRITRRRFLAGGAALLGTAVVGGGAAVLTTPQGRRVLHTAGWLEGDEHPPPAGYRVTARYGTFESHHLRRRVDYAVAIPPTTDGPVPVVYCLHGRRGNERFATESIRLQDFFAAAGVEIAVASVHGGTASYWHRRKDGTDSMAMVIEELVPMVDGAIGNGKRAILGWSMGGYGAILAAQRHPELFDAVVAVSPALWQHAKETAPGAFDSPADFAAHNVFAATDRLDRANLRVDCGADDPFVANVRAFRRQLGEPAGGITPGFHDAGYWRKAAPDQVGFLAARLT